MRCRTRSSECILPFRRARDGVRLHFSGNSRDEDGWGPAVVLRMSERSTFKVCLILDRDQKRTWLRLESQAHALRAKILSDLDSQVRTLGILIHKSLYMEGLEALRSFAPDLDTFSMEGTVSAIYDVERARIESAAPRPQGRKSTVRIRVCSSDVTFSTSEHSVRIPYLGLVRHRKNRFIIPSTDQSDNKSWLWRNVSFMELSVFNNDNILMIDCS